MLDALAGAIIVSALLVGTLAAVPLLRPVRIGRLLLVGLGVLEAAVLAQLVVAIVLASTAAQPANPVTFFGYQIVAVATLPAGLSWSLNDRSGWAPLVLTVACVVVAVLTVRLLQLWAGPVG